MRIRDSSVEGTILTHKIWSSKSGNIAFSAATRGSAGGSVCPVGVVCCGSAVDAGGGESGPSKGFATAGATAEGIAGGGGDGELAEGIAGDSGRRSGSEGGEDMVRAPSVEGVYVGEEGTGG